MHVRMTSLTGVLLIEPDVFSDDSVDFFRYRQPS